MPKDTIIQGKDKIVFHAQKVSNKKYQLIILIKK